MKLTAKIVLAVVTAIILLLGIDACFSVTNTLDQFDMGMWQNAHMLGTALKIPFLEKWRTQGPRHALDLITAFNREENELRIRWVWLDGQADEAQRPRIPVDELTAVRHGKEVFLKRKVGNRKGQAYAYVPVAVDASRPGALELRQPMAVHARHIRSTLERAVVLTLGLIAASASVILLVGTWLIGRPLNRLIEKTRRIGSGDLTGALVLKHHDELAELASALNDMCDHLAAARRKAQTETEARIAAMAQMRHMDRLRTVGRLAAGVAHELGTPLNVVSGRADLIASGRLPPEEVRNSARIVKDQSERMARIIRNLLDFARHRTPNKSRVNLIDTLRHVFEILAPLARKAQAELVLHGGDAPVMVHVDSYQFEQVLINLMVNGFQAMPGGGTLTVEVVRDAPRPSCGANSETGFACVRVLDEGEGIRPENMASLFDPFFTTKEVGEGTGLGLSIAYGIVSEHGGYIDVASEPGHGSCFSIYIPKEA